MSISVTFPNVPQIQFFPCKCQTNGKCCMFNPLSTNLPLLGSSWYLLFHLGHLETVSYQSTSKNGPMDELLIMTACGRKSTFRFQAKFKTHKVISSALFKICSGEEWNMVWGGEQLCWKALEICSPRTSSWYLGIFTALATALFLSHVSFRKGGWDTWRLLFLIPTRCRLNWFYCVLSWERFGDSYLYSIITVGLSGNYSE